LADKVLLSFLYHADLLRLVFTIDERNIASKRIKKLLKCGKENGGVSETLKQLEQQYVSVKDL
jgi:hypothetical protein